MLFLDALATRVLVCDGATGSLLYDKGVFVNQSFEALNLTRPDLVRDIHRAYVDAGADVIETNTFGANAPKLGGFGLDTRLDDINVAGVRLAREAVGSAGLVAGAMGPLGVGVGDNGPLSPATAGVLFAEQAAVLIDGGVDLVMLETFDRLHELEVATHAVGRLAKVPVIAQMSTGQDGCSRDGVPPEQFAERLAGAGASMVGVNCGGGPAATLEALERMATRSTVPLSAQPNAGGGASG
ncbi:MAG: homocysteine S-methyltransferase family protein [Acidobacteriota bacterium]|nr:homocysteine S-methyltransferase family protein [Acidobacteriota bacterium]